ncbi:single-stranded DNA-binding protein [Akkermansia sp.]|uniref:single-stranded DNA-binding protein n=1 Tax=Akkermansia sp. TaxID=1872421 RepID=UPI0025B7E50C|nr:single-stranded DNA-binding protein [Akkermansia sp.]MCD8272410.1 single-stranded DNA-binding protein [Akkermansia sp.]
MYLNDVKLLGEVGADAALKNLANDGAIMDFVLITTENFKNYKNIPMTKKEEHRIVAFNDTAKNAAPEGRLSRGTKILVEGFLRSHEFNGHLIPEVIARRVQTLS